jgi:hypothetical protein
MSALYTVLTGRPGDEALILVEQKDGGQLYRCADSFVHAMADANELLIRLRHHDEVNGDKEHTSSLAQRAEWNAAWLANGKWHASMMGTGNRLVRIGRARVARDKGQPLYCWYGPPVREYVVVQGRGPYQGKK